MESFLNNIKKMDWGLNALAVLMSLIGIIGIYSASFFEQDFLDFKKQIIFLIIGFCLMIILSFFDWKIFRSDSYLILALYILSILSLVLVLFIGPNIQGVRSWYRIGPISIDPIEPMKLILIILLAKYFSMRHVEMYKIIHILISGIYVLLPCFFIALQPDLGSAFILILLWIGILIISGIEIKHFLILLFCAILVFGFSWNHFLKEYQKQRVLSFITPNLEPLGAGWSLLQSKIAIGSGGFKGTGLKQGSQTQLGFITAEKTDFIFAVIAEEFGFFGVSFLLFIISVFFWKVINIAFITRNNFEKLFCLGYVVLFSSQIFVNIGMNLGILPVIGISLPFVSYGGSSLITNFIGLSILQNTIISKP
ncbi:MAG: rod shape-determining protein RodA [Candidatus Pacebacteria bacterium]|nr:rod shape-determining protein RodA [Candidatus Paceibacterota bacterium]